MPHTLPRCQLVPEPTHQVRFLVDGDERLSWHFSKAYPRPFFYPLLGPSGKPLTRMGHPGAPDHDHHQSVWFAHADLGGVNFWSNGTKARIRQKEWLCYEDGDDRAAMAVRLHWLNEGQDPLLQQDLTAIIRPLPNREWLLELQSLLAPTGDHLVINQSNFGLLAVRVAKSLSVHFGGGKLTSSEGAETEAEGFGQYAHWWDYSGPVSRKATGRPGPEADHWNGITYYDHPANPGSPAHWHVREDGWMGASLTRHDSIELKADQPLRVRYLLHVHNGPYDEGIAREVAKSFESWPWYRIVKSNKKHQANELQPEDE